MKNNNLTYKILYIIGLILGYVLMLAGFILFIFEKTNWISAIFISITGYFDTFYFSELYKNIKSEK